MSKPFRRSPEDEAIYAKWRRGVLIFYGCIGLAVITVAAVARLSGVAFQAAAN
jgi:hypothetical protein